MSEKEFKMPALGESFPTIAVETTVGAMLLPDSYKGKWFVLFSHPGDFTPVCSSEFESFSMSKGDFDDLGCELIGLSLDSVDEHKKWQTWFLDHAPVPVVFPIIGGVSAETLALKLGMVFKHYGNRSVRTVFIVDPNGILRLMMYYPMEIGRNISEILRSVRALQKFDKEALMTPADWPNNKWLGKDATLVPTPKTDEGKLKLEKGLEKGEILTKAPWFNFIPGKN